MRAWGAVIATAGLILVFMTSAGAQPNSANRPYLPPPHFSPGAAEGIHNNPGAPVYRHEATRIQIPSAGSTHVVTGGAFISRGSRRHQPPVYGPCPRTDGYWEWRSFRVWVPARWEVRYVPPVYGREWRHGRSVTVLIRDGYHERFWAPGYYEWRQERVWVPVYGGYGRR